MPRVAEAIEVPAELLAQVPLTQLPNLPPDSIESEISKKQAIERAMSAERDKAKLYRDLVTERTLRKHLQEEIELMVEQTEVLRMLQDTAKDVYDAYPLKDIYSGGSATAMLVLTDWHCEEHVDPETINGLNEFNLEIAAERIRNCTQRFLGLLESVRSISNIRRVAIPILGDMITGHLHDDQKESNLLSPTEALIFARDHLHSVIDTISTEAGIDGVDIYTCIGNHGRTTDRPRVATAYKQSYEWLLYQWMAKDYENNPKVNWHVNNSYFNVAMIEGKHIRFHHGDELRYQGGVGGITIPVLKAIQSWGNNPPSDLDVFGHWHQFLRHPKFVACNCLIGYNAYAQRRVKASFSLPSQTFIVIDRNRPGAVDVREIFCD